MNAKEEMNGIRMRVISLGTARAWMMKATKVVLNGMAKGQGSGTAGSAKSLILAWSESAATNAAGTMPRQGVSARKAFTAARRYLVRSCLTQGD